MNLFLMENPINMDDLESFSNFRTPSKTVG